MNRQTGRYPIFFLLLIITLLSACSQTNTANNLSDAATTTSAPTSTAPAAATAWPTAWPTPSDTQIVVPPSPYPVSNDAFTVTTIADGFTIPYGIAIISDDAYFISDRIGELFHVQAGQLTKINGLPEMQTMPDGRFPAIIIGGLMDIALHPHYPTVPWLYITYLDKDSFATVARVQIQEATVTQIELVFQTRSPGPFSTGMRLVWEDADHFFLNVGAATQSTQENPVLMAQDLAQDWGKIHRLHADGRIPADNPIFAGYDAPTSIWSYGHRDSQGLHFDQATGALFGLEHGPRGGHEFNIIEKGGNYGWPLFSYGIDYSRAEVSTITEAEAAAFTILPEHTWTVMTARGGRAVAPACLLFVTDSNVADWNGYFLFGSLAFRRLMKFDRATGATFGLTLEGRVRTIAQLPGGDLIALIERTDLNLADGRIVRLSSEAAP